MRARRCTYPFKKHTHTHNIYLFICLYVYTFLRKIDLFSFIKTKSKQILDNFVLWMSLFIAINILSLHFLYIQIILIFKKGKQTMLLNTYKNILTNEL